MVNQQGKHRRNINEHGLEKNGLQNFLTPIEAGISCKCHTTNGLHHYKCMPKHLQLNQYVHTGYRAGLSTWDCFKSLFYLHNESFNIYSHGLAAIVMIIFSPYFYKTTLLQFDPILYPIHHITCTACVLFSAIYHLMSCHETGGETYRRLITLDYLGIWLATALCCITFIKATFFCFQQALIIVAGIYFLISFICLAYIKEATSASARTRPLIVLGAVRILFVYPTRFILKSVGYMTGPLGTTWYMLGIEMTGLCAAIVNLSCVPERYLHGKLDYFFNSHNIMHIFVLLGPVLMHSGTVIDFEWMKNAECPI